MLVRLRTEGDLDECVQLAGVVHERDGYPASLATDLRTFLVVSDARGLWPVLDVSSRFAPAIELYERSGWVRAGSVRLELAGQELEEIVYLGPAG